MGVTTPLHLGVIVRIYRCPLQLVSFRLSVPTKVLMLRLDADVDVQQHASMLSMNDVRNLLLQTLQLRSGQVSFLLSFHMSL